MKISNLKDNPELYKECISLIEKSFGYNEAHNFDIDFYPLMRKSNHHNCFILVEDNKVVAHIGVLEKNIRVNLNTFKINFYGGIAVDETLRGKGYFKRLFNHVLEYSNNCALKLLWSDKIDLYKKFKFYPSISQFEYNKQVLNDSNFFKSSFNELSKTEKKQIKVLYEKNDELRVLRNDTDWECLAHIISSDLYIKKTNSNIVNYFYKNKGADLQEIIHEYGFLNKTELKEMQSHGKVWTPHFHNEFNPVSQYSSLVSFGKDAKYFFEFFTNNRIQILKIIDNKINFQFDGKYYTLTHQDFLTGVLGPGHFEEFSELKKIYICGRDSI